MKKAKELPRPRKPAPKLKQSTLDKFASQHSKASQGQSERGSLSPKRKSPAKSPKKPKATGPSKIFVIEDSDDENDQVELASQIAAPRRAKENFPISSHGNSGPRGLLKQNVLVEDSQAFVPGTQHNELRGIGNGHPPARNRASRGSRLAVAWSPLPEPSPTFRPSPSQFDDPSQFEEEEEDLERAIFPERDAEGPPQSTRCPLCALPFPTTQIAQHASECQGPLSDASPPRLRVTEYAKALQKSVVGMDTVEDIEVTQKSQEALSRPARAGKRRTATSGNAEPDLVVLGASPATVSRERTRKDRRSAPGPSVIHVLVDDEDEEGHEDEEPIRGSRSRTRKSEPIPRKRRRSEDYAEPAERSPDRPPDTIEDRATAEEAHQDFDHAYFPDHGWSPNDDFGHDDEFGPDFDGEPRTPRGGDREREESLSPLQGFVDLNQLRETGQADRYLRQFEWDSQGRDQPARNQGHANDRNQGYASDGEEGGRSSGRSSGGRGRYSYSRGGRGSRGGGGYRGRGGWRRGGGSQSSGRGGQRGSGWRGGSSGAIRAMPGR